MACLNWTGQPDAARYLQHACGLSCQKEGAGGRGDGCRVWTPQQSRLHPRASRQPWLSGTAHAFALMFLGKSHTGVNFRVPLRATASARETASLTTPLRSGWNDKLPPLGRKGLQQTFQQLTYLASFDGEELEAFHAAVQRWNQGLPRSGTHGRGMETNGMP